MRTTSKTIGCSLGERLTTLVDGVELVRLIDRDSMSDPEIAAAREQGVRVLRRRNLECYLLDDEVLAALCAEKGHPELAPDRYRHATKR